MILKEQLKIQPCHSFQRNILRTKNWSYMQYKDGTEELYNMKTDSKQFNNLSKSKEDLAQLLRHRKLMEERKGAIR